MYDYVVRKQKTILMEVASIKGAPTSWENCKCQFD
jgi:hypothetical protein